MSSVLGQIDFYKAPHFRMYPKGTVKLISNFTPRKSRINGINSVVVFGIQYFMKEYLIDQWNRDFFSKPKEEAIGRYKRLMDHTLGKDSIDTKHIEDLWDLQYLPLKIRALPEGTLCPIGVPCLTITNTVGHAYWLVNYLETILSCTIWQPMTSATIALEYRRLLNKHAIKTTGTTEGVQFQGHDFSMRGMSSLESACTSGAGHLLSFTGTDVVPAIEFLEKYYGANIEKELVGASVPATEHSVMCMGTKDGEIETFNNLLDLYPNGILSVVSDTWNLWDVVRPGGFCDQLKEKILARDGKLVIRPDSGNPVDIICGTIVFDSEEEYNREISDGTLSKANNEEKGVVELLWEVFGGTTNEKGYKVLDSHIGVIYGDSITLERAQAICERLEAKGFASSNIVFGIGSYTYQYNTRDTFGFAMKATYGEVEEEIVDDSGIVDSVQIVGREIFKAPITDSGEKRSAKGRVCVNYSEDKGLFLVDQVTEFMENHDTNFLEIVFENGVLIKDQSLAEVRARLAKQV